MATKMLLLLQLSYDMSRVSFNSCDMISRGRVRRCMRATDEILMQRFCSRPIPAFSSGLQGASLQPRPVDARSILSGLPQEIKVPKAAKSAGCNEHGDRPDDVLVLMLGGLNDIENRIS